MRVAGAAIFTASTGAQTLLLKRTKDGGCPILIGGDGRCNILPVRVDESRFVIDSPPNSLRRMVRSWALREQIALSRMNWESGSLSRRGSGAADCPVTQVMTQGAYGSATRVFWVVDDGTPHRGQQVIAWLQAAWPTLIPVHTPIQASWVNQIESHFSIIQRKVLAPNDFGFLAEVEDRLASLPGVLCGTGQALRVAVHAVRSLGAP